MPWLLRFGMPQDAEQVLLNGVLAQNIVVLQSRADVLYLACGNRGINSRPKKGNTWIHGYLKIAIGIGN